MERDRLAPSLAPYYTIRRKKMTQEQIFAFNESILHFTGTDLLKLKELIDQKIQEEYDKPQNFMHHDKVDDYIYIIDYIDGSYHYDCIGRRSYEEYISNIEAVRIRRKTKSLYPAYETLLEKEVIKA